MGCQNSKQKTLNQSNIEFSIQLEYLRDLFPGKLLSSPTFYNSDINSSLLKSSSRHSLTTQKQTLFFLREFTSSCYQQHLQMKKCLNRYAELLNSDNSNQQLTRILRIKESVNQQGVSMMCNGVYKNFLLFQYSSLSLEDQIAARSSCEKLFETHQIWNIIITGLSALMLVNQVEIFSNKANPKAEHKFAQNYYRNLFINPQRFLIFQQGVLKVRDPLTLSFQDRHIRMKKFYYSPQKIADFTFKDDEKSAVFQLGMTCINAATLQDCFDIYNGYQVDQQKLKQKLNKIRGLYDDQWLIEVLSKMVEMKRCKRFKIREAIQLVNWVLNGQQCTDDVEFHHTHSLESTKKVQNLRFKKQQIFEGKIQYNLFASSQVQKFQNRRYKKVIASIPANIDEQMIRRSICRQNNSFKYSQRGNSTLESRRNTKESILDKNVLDQTEQNGRIFILSKEKQTYNTRQDTKQQSLKKQIMLNGGFTIASDNLLQGNGSSLVVFNRIRGLNSNHNFDRQSAANHIEDLSLIRSGKDSFDLQLQKSYNYRKHQDIFRKNSREQDLLKKVFDSSQYDKNLDLHGELESSKVRSSKIKERTTFVKKFTFSSNQMILKDTIYNSQKQEKEQQQVGSLPRQPQNIQKNQYIYTDPKLLQLITSNKQATKDRIQQINSPFSQYLASNIANSQFKDFKGKNIQVYSTAQQENKSSIHSSFNNQSQAKTNSMKASKKKPAIIITDFNKQDFFIENAQQKCISSIKKQSAIYDSLESCQKSRNIFTNSNDPAQITFKNPCGFFKHINLKNQLQIKQNNASHSTYQTQQKKHIATLNNKN